MKLVVLVIVVILFNLSFSQKMFGSQDVQIVPFEFISTPELRQLLKDRSEKKIDFVLVNTLNELIHNHFHIPGSINIPPNKIDEKISLLGNDKNRLIITY